MSESISTVFNKAKINVRITNKIREWSLYFIQLLQNKFSQAVNLCRITIIDDVLRSKLRLDAANN